MTIFAFALGVSINVLEPAVLGHKMLQFAPEWKNTALGMATFAGLIVAALVQPIIGQLSDRTRSRLGARAPYLILGTVLVILAHFTIAAAPSLIIVVLALLGLQLASNTVQGPWQALIPDQIPSGQRGLASGLKATFDILGFIAGRQMGGVLVAQGQIVGAASVAATAFAGALLVTLISGTSPGRVNPIQRSAKAPSWLSAFKIDWRHHPGFSIWFANRMLFWGAVIAINTFLLFFIIDVHGLPEPAAQRLVAQLGVVLGLAVLVFAIPSGWLTDRIGRRTLITGACILAAAGVLLLMLLHSPTGLTAGAGFLGIGTGVFLSGSWAMVTDLVPPEEAARYLGVANIASAGASAFARGIGGLVIDPLNRATNSLFTGYGFVFAGAAAALLIAGFIILRIPSGDEMAMKA
ncbi:MAG: MFS transporter [Anaerolineales bacterium]